MKKFFVAIIALSLAGLASADDKFRLMNVNDLHKIKDVSAPSISPDGMNVVYAVSRHDVKRDVSSSDLWTVPYEGGKPKNMTRTSKVSEWAPRYSPDGKTIAFLSESKKPAGTQIFVMKARGGKARQVSKIEGGVNGFSWAPDSKHIVLTAFVGGAKPNKAGTVPPIVIDRFQFKEDWTGYLASARSHIFTLDITSKKAAQITKGDQDYWLPAWSPDGKWIAYVSKDNGDADRNMDSDVFIMKPEPGARPTRISQFIGTDVDPYWASPPAWSPDSKQIAWLQSGESKWIYYTPWQLTIADIETGNNRNVARIDRNFFTPQWSSDGKSIYALVEQDRATWLVNINVGSGAISYLTKGNRFSLQFDVAANGNLVLLDSNDDRPFELFAVAGEDRRLTNHNAWLDGVQLGTSKRFTFMNEGHEISGIMTLPAGYKKGEKYPTIFRLHGGPVYQFSHEFMSDWQIYSAQGYVVVGINPRGSSGKGFKFSQAIYADWGNVDVSDILAGTDYLIKEDLVDKNHMGVGGWSYGGMLTNYTIGTDTRFKAAVSGAGTANMFGNYGNDQYSRELELELGTPWEKPENYERVSFPFLHADKISTPTLFQCAEKDFNVPCLGAEQMYQALRSLDVDTQLIIYPGQHHGINVPSYLIDRMQRNLDWYDKHLMSRIKE